MTPPFRLVVNEIEREVELPSDTSLLQGLRDGLGLTGTKYGCGEGVCGACTVLVEGQPTRSCVTPLGEVIGRRITTIEGLAREGQLHPVQRAFLEEGALQCGFCTPGMVLATAALLEREPDPDDGQIAVALAGNICRCGTYPRIRRAVHRARDLVRDPGSGGPGGALLELDLPSTPPGPRHTPWDLTGAHARGYFDLLSDGLVAVLPPERVSADRSGPQWGNGGAWVHVGDSGRVTAFTGKVDGGQGNRTALTQLVAEELRVAVDEVALVMGDTDVSPFDVGTFGSRSMPDAGEYLRAATAGARVALVLVAADRWDCSPDDLVAESGTVRLRDGSRHILYGELLAGLRQIEVISTSAPVTPPDQWLVAGQPTPKLTAPSVVTGAKRYPSDLVRPGMLHGKVLTPPSFGATLRTLDVSGARAVSGVTVIEEDGLVGVVAPDPAAARTAMAAIRASWDEGRQPSESELVDYLRTHPVKVEGWGGSFDHEVGDVDHAFTAAPVQLTQTYTLAYIAHVPLETHVALAEWQGDELTVWTGTQTPFNVRRQLAQALEVPEDQVHVLVPDFGGGFGGKHAGELAISTARLARACGAPVRIQWSREEEFRLGHLRPAAVIDVRSGTGAQGELLAWEFTNINSGPQASLPPYWIPSQRIRFEPARSPLGQGPYRALAATANHFARESHIDEIANQLGMDPLELRLRNLRDERLATVFRAVAERAGWDWRAGHRGTGLGIAGGLEKGGRVATSAEVRVDPDGRLEVIRIVTGYECGAIVNPDNLVNQIEGATVMGLGGALFEAIHFEAGRIINSSMSQYRVPHLADIPPLEVILIDRKDVPSAGAGETPIVAIAPAIANAVFAATGIRIRSMPLAPDGFIR